MFSRAKTQNRSPDHVSKYIEKKINFKNHHLETKDSKALVQSRKNIVEDVDVFGKMLK